MTDSMNFLPIEDIKDNLVFLKDGSVSLVLTTSAVNFGLLFETEQISIIESFAGLLNSLSFPIQITILSKRLNVSSYLATLDKAINTQTNPPLKAMTLRFRQFVESIIKENNVLDKEFYVCVSATSFELGILPKKIQDRSLAAATILSPRRDHLIKQLERLGIKASQLSSVELIKLFYEIYNPAENSNEPAELQASPQIPPPKTIPPKSQDMGKLGNLIVPISTPTPAPLPASPVKTLPPKQSYPLAPPFIVEELNDNI